MNKIGRKNRPPYNWKKIVVGDVHFIPEEKIFGIPIPCDAILQLRLMSGIPDTLFGECHIAHTDQIKILNGKAIVLIIFDRKIHYIPLNQKSDLLIIPASTWHSLINIDNSPLDYQNWMIDHKKPVAKDYYPAKTSHSFDLELANLAFVTNQAQIVKLYQKIGEK